MNAMDRMEDHRLSGSWLIVWGRANRSYIYRSAGAPFKKGD